MGVKFLHDFIEANSPEEEIDLIKVAPNHIANLPDDQRKPGATPKFCLVIDGESCLNRLYGGFNSDWVCGGQWNRMANFIRDLVKRLNNANIEIVVFFNGAIEPQRMNEWITIQKNEYFKIQKILSLLKNSRFPPKGMWTAPTGLRMSIKMQLRQMNVNVVSTIDDHRQEVIAYCRENNVHGLIADDAEYIAFDPPRLFSAAHLKLTFRGNLFTREYMVSNLMKELELNNEKLCVLAGLLGNYLLLDTELKDLYEKLQISMKEGDYKADTVIRKLSQYLNEINLSTDLDDVVQKILGSDKDHRAPRLKQSIQYYLNGTKDGFLKYRSVSSGKRGKLTEKASENVDLLQEPDLDTTTLASERAGADEQFMKTYKGASASLKSEQENNTTKPNTNDSSAGTFDDKSKNSSAADKKKKNKKEKPAPVLPQVSHEVMRTLSERHSKGLMSPHIYQILSQGEIKLPVVMENEQEIPNIYSFYKPIRQMVYAIVFNLHHHEFLAQKENRPLDVDIRIKEWVYNKAEKAHKAEYVKAVSVGWKVPTIQRLWFGTTQDDKRRRLRAFLTCMRSDVQFILNPEYVPQQTLVAAVVLRYMMSFPEKKVLRKHELDAFIVSALAPEFADVKFTDSLQDPVSHRGVQLAAMFMKGVEMALLVNDACGAPIPWLMCCPWYFFDGKLFNHMLNKASTCKVLTELCDNRLGLCLLTERMRMAILEGLDVQFARPPLPFQSVNSPEQMNHGKRHPGFMNPHSRSPNVSAPPLNVNRPASEGSGRGRRSLGGRLEVAGIVVGNWAANYNMSQQNYDTASSYTMSPSQEARMSGSYTNFGYRARSGFTAGIKGKSFKPPYGKKKPVKKDKKLGVGRGMTVGSLPRNTASEMSTKKANQNGDETKSSLNDSDFLNGNDTNTSTERFGDAIVNGAAVGCMGEGDGANSVKNVCEAPSSLVDAVTNK